MQIIYCSPYRTAEGKPRAELRKAAVKDLGPDWLDKLQAEDSIIEIFNENLDDDYHLIVNVLLLEGGPDADLLLVGPNGVWVAQFVYGGGEFKAEGDQWLVHNPQSKAVEPAESNPVTAAKDNAGAVYEYLHSKELFVPWVNPLILLTDPAITVFSEGSAISIVKTEEVYQFVTQEVRALEAIMDETDVQLVVSTFKPFFGDRAAAADGDETLAGPKRFMGMSTVQWLVIIGLALLNLCVLGGFAWYVLTDS